MSNLPDLNTSRDWRKAPENGITEDDIQAPLQHQDHPQDEDQEDHKDSSKKSHKHHKHHKHHHHHKRKTSSSHSNRISPGGREALESSQPNTPYLPNLPNPGDGDDDKAQYNRIPMDDWVKRWEGKKENFKVAWNSDKNSFLQGTGKLFMFFLLFANLSLIASYFQSLLNINRYATKKTISQVGFKEELE